MPYELSPADWMPERLTAKTTTDRPTDRPTDHEVNHK